MSKRKKGSGYYHQMKEEQSRQNNSLTHSLSLSLSRYIIRTKTQRDINHACIFFIHDAVFCNNPF